MNDKLATQNRVSAAAAMVAAHGEAMQIHGRYKAQCFEFEGGPLLWEDEIENVVCTLGKNSMFDNFIAGSSFTQTGPYMGLISSVSWTNLATTISSLTSYSGTTITLATSAAHGLGVGDTFTIASATGTGTNYSAVNGTWVAAAGTTGTTLVFSIAVSGLAISTLTGGSVTTASGTRIGDTMASHANWTEAGSTNAPTFASRGTPSWSASSGGSKSTSSAVSFTMTSGGTLEGAFLVLGSGAVTTLMNTSGTLFSAGAFTGGAQVVQTGNVVNVSYSVSC